MTQRSLIADGSRMAIMRGAIFVVLLLLVGGSWTAASAQTYWGAGDYRDPLNAETVKAAIATSSDGVGVAIFRSRDGVVRWVLSLPADSFERLPASGRIGAVRIDNLEVRDLEISGSAIVEEPAVQNRLVRSRLWHGDGLSPTRGTLRDLLDGRTMTVRLFLDGGGHADGEFSLVGAPAAIAEAIGVAVEVDQELAQRELERDTAMLNASTMCSAQAEMIICHNALTECLSIDINALTPQHLHACMAEAGFPFD